MFLIKFMAPLVEITYGAVIQLETAIDSQIHPQPTLEGEERTDAKRNYLLQKPQSR